MSIDLAHRARNVIPVTLAARMENETRGVHEHGHSCVCGWDR
jgi:hypothetical protein